MAHIIDLLDPDRDRALAEDLLGAYFDWIVPRFAAEFGLDLDPRDALARVMQSLDAIGPPDAVGLIGRSGTGPAGAIVFLHRMRPRAGQIKRLYVDPSARGSGLGRAMLRRLCDEARSLGMDDLYLDTASFMHAAHALYRAEGFEDCPPYPEAEHGPEAFPTVIYMHKGLGGR